MESFMKRSALSLLIGTLVFSSTVEANDQGEISERARLANVMMEITYLQQYLKETKQARKQNIRTRFAYDRLHTDLETIKSGIGEYVDQQLTRPKQRMLAEDELLGAYQQ